MLTIIFQILLNLNFRWSKANKKWLMILLECSSMEKNNNYKLNSSIIHHQSEIKAQVEKKRQLTQWFVMPKADSIASLDNSLLSLI